MTSYLREIFGAVMRRGDKLRNKTIGCQRRDFQNWSLQIIYEGLKIDTDNRSKESIRIGVHMIRTYLIAATLLAAPFADAQPPGGMGGGAPQAIITDVDRESLILQIPAKWYPYHRTTDAKVDTFIFPTGQEPSDWKEALQSERFLTTLGVTTARQVYEFRTQGTNCTEHSVTLSKEALENGYSMAQWVESCMRDDTEVVTLAKTIVGNEQLYVINKIWKYVPGDSDMSEWESYMDEIYVCDPTVPRKAHSCRPPNAAQRAGGGQPRQ
jgi:hypothetical protein